MVVPSSRLTVLLSLQILLLSFHLTRGGIISSFESIRDASGAKPRSSQNQTQSARPAPLSSHQGSLGEEPTGTVRKVKPNDSPKDRSEKRMDFRGGDSLPSPQSSPTIYSDVGTRKGNSSVFATRVPTSPPLTGATVARSLVLEEIERLARLEMLKRTFLEQLGLDRPPNVTRPKPDVPAVVLNRLLLDGEQNDQPRRLTDTHPRQIVVFADEDYSNCGPDVADDSCFKFQVPDQMDNAVVFSSHIWVYVTHVPEGASVFVGRPQHHYGSKWRILASRKLYSQEGWVELEIPADKHKWNRRSHYFEISTKPLSAGGNRTVARDSHHRPMLMLAMIKDGRSSRAGRSVGQCTSGQTSCCMKDFVADFEEIGWDSWIIQPASFNAHYCAGDCGVSSRHFLKDHTEMIALFLQLDQAEADMTLCCVTNEISGLTVLYYDSNGVLHQRLIDVVVENCGCL